MAEVDASAAERACAVVRRYLADALFGGDEQALRSTVADGALQERAWLFWAAFSERELVDLDELFANADGTRVACHFSGSLVQIGPWITAAPSPNGRLTTMECTAIYVLNDARITNFRETWR